MTTTANIIWTAKGIAKYLGCSPEYVRRTLASEPDTPIRQRGRRMYVYRADLDAFMHAKPLKAA